MASEVQEYGLLFKADMVRSILRGQKTQTRRIFKQAEGLSLSVSMDDQAPGVAVLSWLHGDGPGYDVHEALRRVRCPYGVPGERIVVRESLSYDCEYGHYFTAGDGYGGRVYLCSLFDNEEDQTGYSYDGRVPERSVPSIHMLRCYCRILLEITDVRVERLHAITDADARAEGCEPRKAFTDAGIVIPGQWRMGYRDLWEVINGAGSWDLNPMVWVVSFKRIDMVSA